MKIPYGRSNFEEIRRRGFFYVDKTPFLPMLESDEAGYAYLLFLRPRRMGKSLLASMLEHYYDLAREGQWEDLFRGLWVHEHPTPERSRYLALALDFSPVSTDGSAADMRRSFTNVVKNGIRPLLMRYRARFPDLARFEATLQDYDDAADLIGALISIVGGLDHKLYVIIDEYDNFANRLLSDGAQDVYEAIVQRTGFVRSFYAALKVGTQTGAVARLFITGVSPILLDDLSSGFNIVTNISTKADFNLLAGFSHADVTRAVDQLLTDRPDVMADPRLSDRRTLMDVLVTYYNGYRFAPGALPRVFNSDMVLYFLQQIQSEGRYPADMLDLNVRTDYQRLQRIGMLSGAKAEARRAVLETIVSDGYVDSPLVQQFGLKSVTARDQFVSLLYYLGMLTLGDQPPDSAVPRLEIPNRVIRELQWEHLAHALAEEDDITIDTADLEIALKALGVDGDIQPFITLFHERAVKAMGLKDLRKLDEKSLKLMLMAFVSLSKMFHVLSEKEFAQGYCDLFLGASRHVPGAKYAWLLELKYVPTDATEQVIESAFAQGASQVARYSGDAALLPMLVGHRALRAGTLVFVGAQRILYRASPGNRASTPASS